VRGSGYGGPRRRRFAVRPLGAVACGLALCLLGACATPVTPASLAEINHRAGYRYNVLEKHASKVFPDIAVILTFSGGGTRAAALADGVLHGMEKTTIPTAGQPVRLVDEIDVISSVSGGSVTAAYFGLKGTAGLPDFETSFLRRDVMSRLIANVFNPVALARPRIDVLRDYFNDEVFYGATYQDLIAADTLAAGRRPYVVLNATDIGAEAVFSFTQEQFDLICGDLAQLKLGDAVAASAAFPVALSALTVRNNAPCQAQEVAAAAGRAGWERGGARQLPRPISIDDDLAGVERDGIRYPAADNLARYRAGSVALGYLNQDPADPKTYIQLLDGGVADNVGLTRPLEMLTSTAHDPSFLSAINTGRLKRLLLVVVNARNQSSTDFGTSARPPGLTTTLLTTIGTPIDSMAFRLIDSLDAVLADAAQGHQRVELQVAAIDFDYVVDNVCRQRFHAIATSWTLPKEQVNALIDLGETMILDAPNYRALVQALGGQAPSPAKTMAEVCAELGPPS